MRQQVESLVSQGYTIGLEYADQRRFRRNSWQNAGLIEGNAKQVLAELESHLAQHSKDYVRLVGIDSKAKRRIVETLIQKPGQQANATSSKSQSAGKGFGEYNQSNQRQASQKNGSAKGHLDKNTVEQVRSLLKQGYKIGTEHADKRRFSRNSWQGGSPIESTREGDVLSALENSLAEHKGEYVRLVGIDPKAKRRVLETTIQQPA